MNEDQSEERKRRIDDFSAVLKIGGFFQRRQEKYSITADYSQSGLSGVSESFERHLHRIEQQVYLIWQIHENGRSWQHFEDRLRLEATGTIEYPTNSHLRSHDTAEDLKHLRVTEAVRKHHYAVSQGAEPPYLNEGVLVGTGVYDLASVAAGWTPDRLENIVRGYCESSIILSWAAFETVAEDLWEAAVNARPSKLASGNLPIDKLKIYRFDVRSNLGTMLKDQSRNFRTLFGIQDAYRNTFQRQGERINSILSEPPLKYTAAVRNVIIHKGGKIDEEYLDQVSRIPNAYRSAVGDKFALTGKMTYDLAEAALKSAADLLNAVHGWIIGHPEKNDERADQSNPI